VSEFSILPSLREGLPTVILESFSLGKSVVATNIPGTNEIAKDNYNSLLVSPENVNELSSAIIRLFKDNDLRENLNKNAYNTYKKQFDFEQYKKKILNFYTF
jgi:glycosyltransferase involved in cell wall biosynthesis